MSRIASSAALLAALSLSPTLHAQAGAFHDSAPTLELAGHPYPTTELETITVTGQAEDALTSPDAREARHAIQHTPGGVDLVDEEQWRDTAARTLKDVLDYTPGVFVQPKWGEDTRLSIRGSGLSRNFHMRGIQLLVDGIPMNAADGSADFQEIDPTAFAYTEVYKGANALRYGANALGGAINFASPTGYSHPGLRARLDGGSFGLLRGQFAGGTRIGEFDLHAAGSYLESDGFRDHADGDSLRGALNVGWRLSPTAETRLYWMGADIEQRIPGAVTRATARRRPKSAAPGNLALDFQRNMQSWRMASKTRLRLDAATLEFGGYVVEKQLIHPIFQYLDYEYRDRGAFLRASFEGSVAGHANRLLLGASLFDGRVDNQQFRNLAGGQRGERLSASLDRADNLALYAENRFDLRPTLTLIAGLQYLDARRRREDRLDDATDTSGRQDYDFTNPKLGLLWQVSAQNQAFANISRSAEAPTFGELNFTNAALADTRAQRATTVEIGTRGSHRTLSWDLSVYRARLRNEFQFFDLGNGTFSVTNADRTVHQGVEAGLAWMLAQDLLAGGDRTTWKLAYTFSDFFFDDDADWGDNELPGAPRHFLRSELHYAMASGFYLAPGLEWVPQGYDVDNANRVQTRRYALLGLRAGYDSGRQWSVYADARNLGDEKYMSSASVVAVADPNSALFEPGDGLAVFVGFRLELAR